MTRPDHPNKIPTLVVPPDELIASAEIRELAKKARDLRDRAHHAHRDVVEFEQIGIPAALDRDAEAYADALAAGAKDPGAKHAEKAAKELAEKQRNRDGLMVAANRAAAALEAEISGQSADWLRDERKRLEQLRKSVGADLDAFSASLRKLREQLVLISWIEGFPNARWNFAPSAAQLPSLMDARGNPLRLDLILDTLRAFVAGDELKAPRQHSRPGELPPPGQVPGIAVVPKPQPLKQRPAGPHDVDRRIAL